MANDKFPPIKEWPVFSDGTPYICVIRTVNGCREHGFIISGSWEVNLGYVWDGGSGEYLTYSSPESVLTDGWTID